MLFGGTGNDTIDGGDGEDTIDGGSGNDGIVGGNGNDQINGMGGNDTILGGDGDDLISGGAAADTLLGQEGDDGISGNGSPDVIDGGEGVNNLSDADSMVDREGKRDAQRHFEVVRSKRKGRACACPRALLRLGLCDFRPGHTGFLFSGWRAALQPAERLFKWLLCCAIVLSDVSKCIP